jgi:uncharacterized damage-inducible protein DinB
MATAPLAPDIELLLQLIDQAYDKKAWHGPNLRSAVRRLNAEQAAWRPHPQRHTIAEIVVHAAYWKYTVRRRLRGDKRGSFPLKGSNWFPLRAPLTEEAWRGFLDLLEAEHRALRAAVAEMTPRQLRHVPARSAFSYAALIQGAAAHDVYHAGQIQLLRRLQGGAED